MNDWGYDWIKKIIIIGTKEHFYKCASNYAVFHRNLLPCKSKAYVDIYILQNKRKLMCNSDNNKVIIFLWLCPKIKF